MAFRDYLSCAFPSAGGVVVVGRPFPAERLDDRLADGVAKNYR